MKIAGADVKTEGTLPEKGMVFPEFSLVAVDDRLVGHADFDGRKKVFFFCQGPTDEAVAAFIKAAAEALDDEGRGDVVLIPVARASSSDWRSFLNASGIEGIAPLSLGADVAVPFPVFVSGDRKGALAPALVYVDDQDEVFAAQLADDAATLAGLDVKKLLTA